MYQGGSTLATSAVVRFRTTPLGANEGAEAHAARGGIFRQVPSRATSGWTSGAGSRRARPRPDNAAGGRGITLRRSVPRRLLVSNGRSVGETTVVLARR